MKTTKPEISRLVRSLAPPEVLVRLSALAGQVRAEVDQVRSSQFGSEDGFTTKRFTTKRFTGKAPVTSGYRQLEIPRPRNPWREKCRRESVVTPSPKARRGEVPLWQFVQSEMARWRESKNSVYGWIKSGRYPWLEIRKVTPRFVFVKVPKGNPAPLNLPRPGEIPLKQFVAREAERAQVEPVAIYMRLSRGSYPGVQLRRVNKGLVFVQMVGGRSEIGDRRYKGGGRNGADRRVAA